VTAVSEGQGVGPLHRLLEVQHHDTAIDQLRHRRDTLPARASLRDVETRLAQLDARTGEVRGHRGELAQRQAAIETQIDQSRTRKSELEKRMFGGQVTAPRELQAMDEEVRHLARHISDLEDRELELMEAIEPLDGDLQAADVERDALEKQASAARAAGAI
jgi:predicted  nucleic acid-binding Zn-ribbon protein